MANIEQSNEQMNMMRQGLERIVVSEDINEIKQIAQELLSFGQQEQVGMEDNVLRDKLSQAMPEEGGMTYA